jgi:hypothetical protein
MRNGAAMLRRLFMCWWGGCGGRIYTGAAVSVGNVAGVTASLSGATKL